MTGNAGLGGPRDGDRLVSVELSVLELPQLVFPDGVPCLRVDDGVRLLELWTDGSEVSERSALRLSLAVWQLANASRLERCSRGAGAGSLGRLPVGGHGIPGAVVGEGPGGGGWVTGCTVRPLRAAARRRPVP
jgi:hypothetical protein